MIIWSEPRTQNFYKGTLVLVCTLKLQKHNVKLKGMGPFAINNLSPSKAIWFETLHGSKWWITFGRRLCVYNEPLTTNMLERIHAAKDRKEAHGRMKLETQQKAWECAACHRQKRLLVKKLNANSTNTKLPPKPLVTLGIETLTKKHKGLLNLGADTNVLLLVVFNRLKNKKAVAT